MSANDAAKLSQVREKVTQTIIDAGKHTDEGWEVTRHGEEPLPDTLAKVAGTDRTMTYKVLTEMEAEGDLTKRKERRRIVAMVLSPEAAARIGASGAGAGEGGEGGEVGAGADGGSGAEPTPNSDMPSADLSIEVGRRLLALATEAIAGDPSSRVAVLERQLEELRDELGQAEEHKTELSEQLRREQDRRRDAELALASLDAERPTLEQLEERLIERLAVVT